MSAESRQPLSPEPIGEQTSFSHPDARQASFFNLVVGSLEIDDPEQAISSIRRGIRALQILGELPDS